MDSFTGRESDFIRANLLLHSLCEGHRNSGAFALGCKAAKAGCGLEAIYANLAKEICNESFTEEELKRTLQSASQKVKSDKTTTGKGGGEGSEFVHLSNSRHLRGIGGNTVYGSPSASKMAFTMRGVKVRSPLRTSCSK